MSPSVLKQTPFVNFPWTSIVESTNANIVPHEETNIGFPNPASLIQCLFETTVIVEKVRYPMVYGKAGSLFCAAYFDSNDESFFSGGVGVVVFFIISSSSSRGCSDNFFPRESEWRKSLSISLLEFLHIHILKKVRKKYAEGMQCVTLTRSTSLVLQQVSLYIKQLHPKVYQNPK